MERSSPYFAAIANAAVPGLEPVTVQALPGRMGQDFDVAFVQDSQERRWVVRLARTAAAGAQMDLASALLALLARRLPFAVPQPRGFVGLASGGRATVYPFLAGRHLDFRELPHGPGIAADVGRSIAAIHNADRALFDEAGVPTYDAETYRTRRLSDVDRAAATGKVPVGLLGRWEAALEDVALWRFAPTPIHGDLARDHILATFADDEDAATGTVCAVTGWEDAKVADPADDFAHLVGRLARPALETVVEAYAHTRAERPDRNLVTRARLARELALIQRLLHAVAADDERLVDRATDRLTRLAEWVGAVETETFDPAEAPTHRPPPPLDGDEQTEALDTSAVAASADPAGEAGEVSDASTDETPDDGSETAADDATQATADDATTHESSEATAEVTAPAVDGNTERGAAPAASVPEPEPEPSPDPEPPPIPMPGPEETDSAADGEPASDGTPETGVDGEPADGPPQAGQPDSRAVRPDREQSRPAPEFEFDDLDDLDEEQPAEDGAAQPTGARRGSA